MNVGKVTKQSLKEIFTNRFKLVALLGVVAISLAFGILYVMAFWDPPGNIKNIDVAVVNLDKGTEQDGETQNYGADIIEELKENDDATWDFVDADTFANGIEDTEYYLAFVIPENFSAAVVSAEGSTPEKANIIYLCNQRKNFLLSQYGENIQTQFSDLVSAAITEEYTKAAFDNLYKVKDGMEEAAEGSEKLDDGVGELSSNVPTLADGVGAAADGVSALQSGLSELNSNMPALAEGASELNRGIDKVIDEIPTLINGVSTLKTGSENLAGGLSKLSSAVEENSSSVDQSIDQMITLIENGQYEAAIGGLQKLQSAYSAGQSSLAGNIEALEGGAYDLNNGIAQVADNAPALSSGMTKLQSGAAALSDGAASAESGVSKLYQGSISLSSGMNSLNAAVPILENGVYALKNGSGALSTALKDGSDELSDGLVNDSDSMANFVSDPEETNKDIYGELPAYGPGFSPLFISLGLWIGVLLIFFVIDARPPRSLKANTFQTVFGKIIVFWCVGIIEAAAIVITSLIINVPCTNTLTFFLFAAFCSLIFVIILQNFNLIFGDLVGKAIAIFFVILQLTSCGGTFPKELLPKFFQTINPYMPFTYSVDGFREIISGGNMSIVYQDMLILAIFGLAFLFLSFIFNRPAEILGEKARLKMAKEKAARALKEEREGNEEDALDHDETIYTNDYEADNEADTGEEKAPKEKRGLFRCRRKRKEEDYDNDDYDDAGEELPQKRKLFLHHKKRKAIDKDDFE